MAAIQPPAEQWKLRQVCAAWTHHFRSLPPPLALTITSIWTLSACPATLLPQVVFECCLLYTLSLRSWPDNCFVLLLQIVRLEFNRVTVSQHMLDRLASCKRLLQLYFNTCVISGGRLPALPCLRDLIVSVSRRESNVLHLSGIQNFPLLVCMSVQLKASQLSAGLRGHSCAQQEPRSRG